MNTLGIFLCVAVTHFFSGQAEVVNSNNGIHLEETDDKLRYESIFEAGSKFKCPLPFGAFSDPDDCNQYYVCVSGIGIHKKCRKFFEFDILRRTCLPSIIATCGNGKGKTTAATSPASKATTPSGDRFTCPSFAGSYPHPEDCSKYYYCMLYRPSLKTCPEAQLFDSVKSSCKPEDQVNCGIRQRPGSTTTEIVPETEPSSTVTETTVETPTEEVDKDTTTVISTTEDFPTGPPETDCQEDDVDCIIDETGDVTNWFKCPEDMGAYIHPSSEKLFIFCMNWIPSVKKCGMDMVFSDELATCIEIK